MRAVVFSGTTEGRVFSKQLAALGAEVLVSVATPLGAEEQGERSGITVHCGRLTPEEMTALLQGADLCVDATHPYAVEATRNIRAACKTAGTEYRRLLRPESPLPAGSMVFASAAHAAGFPSSNQGRTEGNGVRDGIDHEPQSVHERISRQPDLLPSGSSNDRRIRFRA